MKIIWRIIKYFLLFILALIVLSLVWAGAAWLRGDDELNTEIISFYAIDTSHATQNNGAIATLGLFAPADVSDGYGWALQFVKKSEEEKRKFRVKYADQDGSGFVNATTYGSIETGLGIISSDFDQSPNKTEYRGDNQAIRCWLDRQWFITKPPAENESCDTEQLSELSHNNQLLLSRYEGLFSYDNYFDHWSLTSVDGQSLIKLQELYIANLVSLNQTNPEAALKSWLLNMQFYKNALSGHNNLISKSILMVNYGLIQKALPSILEHNDELAINYMNQLLISLSPFAAKDVNIKGTIIAEYQFVGPVIDRLGNYNRNKFLQFYKDFIEAWNSPINEMDVKWKRLDKIYRANPAILFLQWRDWHSPVLSVTTNLILGGTLVGGDLAKAMHMSDARSRILNLYVQMKAQGFSVEQTPEFLATSPKELYNPFTEKPFEYDPASKLIYFIAQPENSPKQGLVLH